MSLYEKMICQFPGCKHPRYLHVRGAGNVWRTMSAPCNHKRMQARKAVTCPCEGFQERESS